MSGVARKHPSQRPRKRESPAVPCVHEVRVAAVLLPLHAQQRGRNATVGLAGDLRLGRGTIPILVDGDGDLGACAVQLLELTQLRARDLRGWGGGLAHCADERAGHWWRGELTIPRGLLSFWLDEWMVDQDDGVPGRSTPLGVTDVQQHQSTLPTHTQHVHMSSLYFCILVHAVKQESSLT